MESKSTSSMSSKWIAQRKQLYKQSIRETLFKNVRKSIENESDDDVEDDVINSTPTLKPSTHLNSSSNDPTLKPSTSSSSNDPTLKSSTHLNSPSNDSASTSSTSKPSSNDSTLKPIHILKGGDSTEQLSINDIEPISYIIEDDLIDLQTNAMLYGRTITEYYQFISMKVMKHLADSSFSGNSNTQREIIEYIRKIMNCKDITFETLKQKFHATSNECLFAYFVRAYLSSPKDMVLGWMYTVGRVLPMKRRDEWFDNFRLNAYGTCFNLIMWNEYNSEDSYSVDYDPKPINTAQQINYSRFNDLLVGSFRTFLMEQHLLPFEYKENKVSESYNGLNLSDLSYKYFPFYFGGAHGCDVFDIPSKSLTVSEIKNVLLRYPSALIGYILNTSTYRSGKGEHWVAVVFSNHNKLKCDLICSQQSTFDVFRDGGKLKSSLISLGFTLEHNPDETQRNNFSCGDLSALSLLKMIEYRDIKQTVANIGINAENFGNEIGRKTNIYKIREKIVGTL